MIPLCIDQGIGLIPWSPLARGFLAGTANAAEAARPSAPTVTRLGTACISATRISPSLNARQRLPKSAVTSSQIALAWILSKPDVTSPIIGATKMEHLDQAIASLDIQLPEEEIKRLEEPYQPHPVLGHS